MKLFAIYAPVNLNDKPDWLDKYRIKYDQFFDFHVTLKQLCYLEEEQIPDVKTKLTTLFSDLRLKDHEIRLDFEKLESDRRNPVDGVIMIQAQNPTILNLQKNILSVLPEYKQYYEPAAKEWEENFQPHITIACNLDPEKFRLALKDIPSNYLCKGVIKEIELAIIDPSDANNAKADKAVIVYKL